MPLKIEHRIGIQSPAEVIWEIIADVAGWEGWNPLYPKASGVIRIGEQLTLELALPGYPLRTIRPRVADWVPNEQIHWRLSAAMGLLRATRYIEIEQLAQAGCIFSNGEVLDGPLADWVSRRTKAAMRAGFTAMGEAVKARAEEAWRAKAPTTT